MFVWKLDAVVAQEGGIDRVVATAKAARLKGLWVKIADGTSRYNVVDQQSNDNFRSLRAALRGAGIDVWGWQVAYGKTVSNAQVEATLAGNLAEEFDLDGILMDAEGGAGYFTGGASVAEQYASTLKGVLQPANRGLAICGNDIPTNFANYPFSTFAKYADINAPQTYYGSSPSVADRVQRAAMANAIYPIPFAPVGAGWVGNGGGCATATDCAARAGQFIQLVAQRNFPAYAFWHWAEAPSQLWDVLKSTPP